MKIYLTDEDTKMHYVLSSPVVPEMQTLIKSRYGEFIPLYVNTY